MKISVLRLGHRYSRDKRISTHVGLVARAFGANELVMDIWDNHVENSIQKVVEEWGNSFRITFISEWKKFIRGFNGDKIHLTMYGININEIENKLRASKKDKLIIIGGKKVHPDVYNLVDYNVAIGNQPHSEVAALAVFLDRLYKGKELEKEFKGRMKIIPQKRGKRVLRDDT
ncbi:MAG: tRNA (cytidine(56)-2'-O)-methyltransferase [Candidatus Altiarchaeales archaeon]|nr:MAG: tRNA (cytidine(56)-2'-O)-methyltransferase [Candidatus Altiarchaeales archaeon]